MAQDFLVPLLGCHRFARLYLVVGSNVGESSCEPKKEKRLPGIFFSLSKAIFHLCGTSEIIFCF